MPVAKTYQSEKILTQPYEEDGKMYVKVDHICGRCGGVGHYSFDGQSSICYECRGARKYPLKVRWYTDKEYAAMERANERAREKRQEKREAYIKDKKAAWPERNGFAEGKTIVVCGDTFSIKDELKELGCKFAYGLGWHFAPGSIDEEKIAGLVTVVVTLEESTEEFDAGYEWKDEKFLAKLVKSKMPAAESASKHQGNVGEKIIRKIVVKRALDVNGRFGESFIYVMEDEEGNIYKWSTKTVYWESGEEHTILGTVKEHSDYNGIPQTVLTRCKEK